MNITQQIENYTPYNEQEAKDKELFIHYFDNFNNYLSRDNIYGHISSSVFLLNKERTHIIMIYHKIYKAWGWMGGHSDGEEDQLKVAIKEAEEESGLKNITPVSKDIHIIDTLPVQGHFRKGIYVPAHIHLNVAYVLETDMNQELIVNKDETDGVKWVPIAQMPKIATEYTMIYVYNKAIKKMKEKRYIK